MISLVALVGVVMLSSVCCHPSVEPPPAIARYPLEFKLGLLVPWTGTGNEDGDDVISAATSASAVSIAIERVHSDTTLNGTVKLSLVSQDSGCNSKLATGNIINLFIIDKVDAFIGPPCSQACRPAAALASFWNKPMVTWMATDPDLADKTVFTTLARTLGPFSKMAAFLADVMHRYGWSRVVMVTVNRFLWMDAARSIKQTFLSRNITISWSIELGARLDGISTFNVLEKIKSNGRIVLLLMSKSERRRFLLAAHGRGMTSSGEYVFFTFDLLPEGGSTAHAGRRVAMWSGNDGRDQEAAEAFESVFHVTPAVQTDGEIESFLAEVVHRMRQPPWDKFTKSVKKPITHGDKMAAFLHDAVLLYAVAINRTISRSMDPRSGEVVADNMRHLEFNGMTGKVIMDDNGDRNSDYWLMDLSAGGDFVVVAKLFNLRPGVQIFNGSWAEPRWPNGSTGFRFIPRDVPTCGFDGELCHEKAIEEWVIPVLVVSTLAVLLTLGGIAILIFRQQQSANALLIQSWRVQWEDVELIKTYKSLQGSTPMAASMSSGLTAKAALESIKDSHRQQSGAESMVNCSGSARISSGNGGSHAAIASGAAAVGGLGSVVISASNGSSASVQPSATSAVSSTRGQLFAELGLYRGVVAAVRRVNRQHFQLTKKVIMEFLEVKEIMHENLNAFVGACIEPPNMCVLWKYCVRGSLNVTDYGLPSLLAGQEVDANEVDVYKRKLWTAPELLRDNFPPPLGTQAGDVYSFAIVCTEIINRADPYNLETYTPRDIVNRIRNGESIPVRPVLQDSAIADFGPIIVELIKSCWSENPKLRPSFKHIRRVISRQGGANINILDSAMKMMEKYAQNLESIVEERALQLLDEKQKTDRLLWRLLPPMAARNARLTRREESFAWFVKERRNLGHHKNGLQLSSRQSAALSVKEIVIFLNELYSCFDDVIEKHDVYKVETIGDAYVVVGGVPTRIGKRHVSEIADVALDLLSTVTSFKIPHRPEHQLQIRIGLHTGSVVAGVVGNVMPRYCLFGDTVNIAQAFESSGKPMRIHISKQFRDELVELSLYQIIKRGETSIRGRGLCMTYWLYGKKGYEKPLPAFERNDVPSAHADDVTSDVTVTHMQQQQQQHQSHGVDQKPTSASSNRVGSIQAAAATETPGSGHSNALPDVC